MKFVKVNYYLNKNFFVEECAYKDMVFKTLKDIKKQIKIKKLDVVAHKKENSFIIFLEIVKNFKNEYLNLINQMQKELEEKSQLLINSKPINIEIKFIEN